MMQEELPSQHDMKIGGHNGFMPYMAVANGIAGALSGPSESAVRQCHVVQAQRAAHTCCCTESEAMHDSWGIQPVNALYLVFAQESFATGKMDACCKHIVM